MYICIAKGSYRYELLENAALLY